MPSLSWKRQIVQKFVAIVDSWNQEFHQATEQKVFEAYREMFAGSEEDSEAQQQRIEAMRTFYVSRIALTATLLVGGASLLVSTVALVVSFIALFR